VSSGGKGATELRRGGESAETAEVGMGCVSGVRWGRVAGWPSKNTNYMQHPGGHPIIYNFYNTVFVFTLISDYLLFYIISYKYHISFLLFNNNTVNIKCKL
jgi:hypothetical protein